MTRMGAESRRGESASLAEAVARFRPLRWITEPGTLEGGDVVRIGSRLFVGRSTRSNDAGIAQLARELVPLGYGVQSVEIQSCLHLKSTCPYLGRGTLLAKRGWVDMEPFGNAQVIDFAPGRNRPPRMYWGSTIPRPRSRKLRASSIGPAGACSRSISPSCRRPRQGSRV